MLSVLFISKFDTAKVWHLFYVCKFLVAYF
nr:MAG TPA: hypothetical protein [Bacteriophage sp.]